MYGTTAKTFILYLLVTVLISSSNAGESRMVGSPLVHISKIPYIVQLRLPKEFLCGGTLITSQHVITAAHCVHGEDYRTITVVGGATSTHEIGIQRKITKTFVPPQFTIEHLENDIAVLKLDRPMTGPNIATIPLCKKTMTDGDIVQISGWGRLWYDGPLSDQLRSAKLQVTSNEECNKQYEYSYKRFPETLLRVSDNLFCAREEDIGQCNGDSGGPVVYNNQLCGVVSWSYGCAYQQVPGVLARIGVVQQFIENALKS